MTADYKRSTGCDAFGDTLASAGQAAAEEHAAGARAESSSDVGGRLEAGDEGADGERAGGAGPAARLSAAAAAPRQPQSRHRGPAPGDGAEAGAAVDCGGGDGGSGSDSDGLLVVKRRDALGAFPLAAAAAVADPEVPSASGVGPEELAKRKKRKRLRIRADAVSGGRVVFDDEGRQLAPLEALGDDCDSGGCASLLTPAALPPRRDLMPTYSRRTEQYAEANPRPA